MLSEDWPTNWPLDPIPTKPRGPPYIEGDFQLHVEPQEFLLHEFNPYHPVWFRIKNPLENIWVEWFIEIPGALQVVGAGFRGILKPGEVSEPIGLLDGPDPDFYDGDWDPLNRKISICFWHVDGKKVSKWKKGEQLADKKGYRLTSKEVGTFYPKVILKPDFDRRLRPHFTSFEPWTPVEVKRRCVIL